MFQCKGLKNRQNEHDILYLPLSTLGFHFADKLLFHWLQFLLPCRNLHMQLLQTSRILPEACDVKKVSSLSSRRIVTAANLISIAVVSHRTCIKKKQNWKKR